MARASVFELLDRLTLKSLVTFHGENGRYSLSESVRDYVLQDESHPGRDLQEQRLRHAEYFFAIAANGKATRSDIENFRTAMDEFERGGKPLQRLQLAVNLYELWYKSGLLREGRSRVENALTGAGLQRTELAAQAQWVIGDLALQEGDYESARKAFEEQRQIGLELQSRPIQARATSAMGGMASDQGNFPLAKRLYLEAAPLHRLLGQHVNEATTYVNLAELHLFHALKDPVDEAERFLDLAAPALRELPRLRAAQWLESVRARILLARSEWAQAKSVLVKSFELALEDNFELLTIRILEDATVLALALDTPADGARLAGLSEKLRRQSGFARSPSETPRWDRIVHELRQVLLHSFEELFAEGELLSPDAALQIVRDLPA